MNINRLIKGTEEERAAALQRIVETDPRTDKKLRAQEGVAYYNYEHDILNNRIFYMDDEGHLKEDTTVSNIKIPHPFFTEQVDQKVNFLLSNPVRFETENERLAEEMEDYYNAQFQTVIRDALEGASIKGHEFVFERTTSDDRLAFQVSDSRNTIELTDNTGKRAAVVRHYNRDEERDGKDEVVTIAEVWTENEITYYKTEKGGRFILDRDRDQNPRPHITGTTVDADGNEIRIGRSYNEIPFYRLSNNKAETTDLEPIKALIDDYDLMAAFLSNNLQDFADAIYVVKNYPGQSMTELRKNLKSRKMVGVGEHGGLEVQTVKIPTEARELKLNIDKEAIYKFGMAFDSTAAFGSNISNVVIRSRYTLLELKANKAENRLRGLLEWINERVVADINRRRNTSYNPKEVTITIDREMMINEEEDAAIKRSAAETQQLEMQTLLAAAARLDSETLLRRICELLELDYEEVAARVEEEDYDPLPNPDNALELNQPEEVGEPDEPTTA